MKILRENPRCPFCYFKIDQPKELMERKLVEFPVGVCNNCGAVFAYDATGHNRGAAFIEALLFACNYDNSLAFSLSYGEGYIDAVIEKYDAITHSVVSENFCDDRYVKGVLIFVKITDGVQEITNEKVKERLKYTLPLSKVKMRSEKFSKEKVHEYVIQNNISDLISLAEEDSRVLNELQKMLSTPDKKLRWRIIEMIGGVSKKVGEIRPDLISKLLTKLLQIAVYPGSSAWGVLEAAGTIISNNPKLFGEYCQTLLAFLRQEKLQKEVIWAIGKIASVSPEVVKNSFRTLRALLKDPDPEIRGYSVWALGEIGFSDVLDDLKDLSEDQHLLSIFEEGELKSVTISHLAKEAIAKIKCPNPS